jgi:uncharacterized Fe-S cluster protein YjdI
VESTNVNSQKLLSVQWDPDKCCHSANCVKSLPEVFTVENGKFVIHPEAAPEADVRRVVAACPASALTLSSSLVDTKPTVCWKRTIEE